MLKANVVAASAVAVSLLCLVIAVFGRVVPGDIRSRHWAPVRGGTGHSKAYGSAIPAEDGRTA
ncbi:MAG: hypothetical protein ACRDOI_27600 [Trebonia sp.]